MTVVTVANVYGSSSVVPLVAQVDPSQLRDWTARMEKTVNDLATMVTRHESTINLQHAQMKFIEVSYKEQKDFMEYVKNAHPAVAAEYYLIRKVSERLTK